ncbi:MAG: hypothetical protein WC763_05200 [Candidatus Paceibacterota bacterium]|jgi:hypothetical protein
MKVISIPARQIAEQTLEIEQIFIIPDQSRLIVQTEDYTHNFERVLSPAELEMILALVEPAVKATLAGALVIEKVVTEEPVVEGPVA